MITNFIYSDYIFGRKVLSKKNLFNYTIIWTLELLLKLFLLGFFIYHINLFFIILVLYFIFSKKNDLLLTIPKEYTTQKSNINTLDNNIIKLKAPRKFSNVIAKIDKGDFILKDYFSRKEIYRKDLNYIYSISTSESSLTNSLIIVNCNRNHRMEERYWKFVNIEDSSYIAIPLNNKDIKYTLEFAKETFNIKMW